MHITAIAIAAFAAIPLVAAHGRVNTAEGNLGGNGTAFGIQGAVIPGPGPNGKTEGDTTQFGSTNIKTNGLGKTTAKGKNNVAMVKQVMALSGPTLPQISSDGNGILKGVFHIVTTDGAGPVQAVLDPTGQSNFADGIMLKVVTQVPGRGGNIKATQGKNANHKRNLAGLWERAVDVITKRATNVNEDYPYAFQVPAGVKCTGTMDGVTGGVCTVKIANNNAAGPFGGIVPVQVVDGAGNGVAANTTVTAPAAAAAKKAGAKARRFQA